MTTKTTKTVATIIAALEQIDGCTAETTDDGRLCVTIADEQSYNDGDHDVDPRWAQIDDIIGAANQDSGTDDDGTGWSLYVIA